MKTAVALKEAGKDQVEEHNPDFLEIVRNFARRFAIKHGSVTTDDIHRFMEKNGVYPRHHNAMGAVFRGEEWTPIGFVQSSRPESKARTIRIWGYDNKWKFRGL